MDSGKRLLLALACLLFLAGIAAGQTDAAAIAQAEADRLVQQSKSDEEVLQAAGVKPDAAGIAEYLKKLKASPQASAEIDKLVAALGAEDWKTRDDATKKLAAYGPLATEALRKAAKSPDAETSSRAGQILQDSSSADAFDRALSLAVAKKFSLPVAVLLDASGACTDDHSRSLLARLLEQSAGEKDLDALRTFMKTADPGLRPLLLPALAKSAGAKGSDEIFAAAKDDTGPLALAAARLLAQKSDRRCLTPLGNLLGAKDDSIRREAAVMLQDLAGKEFLLLSTKGDELAKANKAALAWIDGEGKTAKLNFEQAAPKLLGRTLVCLPQANLIVEYDDTGKKLWSKKVPVCWAAEGLPNGHRLAASNEEKSVTEFDDQGEEVWKVKDLPGTPQCVHRLRNGNTLVACREAKKIVEYTPEGKAAKEIPLEGTPILFQRLPNGLTLVLLKDSETIVEVDDSGKVGWTLGPLQDIMGLQRLPNGNTLVCLSDPCEVAEYDRKGEKVWSAQISGSYGPKGVQRLSNGNTLVSYAAGVREIDKDGKTVAEIKSGYSVAVQKY